MQAQSALARTLASCTSPALCTSELELWLLQPHVLAWLMAAIDGSPAGEEAAGNVALCIGNIAARAGLQKGKECSLQCLHQAGAVRALVGELAFDSGFHFVQYLRGFLEQQLFESSAHPATHTVPKAPDSFLPQLSTGSILMYELQR